MSRFLLVRGLWLVLLELTVARFGWSFNLDYGYASALVFWALGWSMVALAVLVRLPAHAVAATALVMIGGHNLLDGVRPASWGSWGWLWTVLHTPGPIPLGARQLDVWYPLVPWIGVMAAGYLLGPVFARPAPARDRTLACTGVGLSLAFLVLRLANAYGDPVLWREQATPIRTVLSFLNTTKYPPSLAFLLMTLGPALAVMPLLTRWRGPAADAIRTLGRVPLFFWLLHVPLLHLVALGLSLARYGRVIPWLVVNPRADPPSGYGYGLVVVYLASLGVIGMLYPVCAWFAGVKRRRRDPWLSYL